MFEKSGLIPSLHTTIYNVSIQQELMKIRTHFLNLQNLIQNFNEVKK